jgi:hypothetical protein
MFEKLLTDMRVMEEEELATNHVTDSSNQKREYPRDMASLFPKLLPRAQSRRQCLPIVMV